MTDLAIAIIVGGTRPGRKALAVAEWIHQRSAGQGGVRYDVVDLADHPLPFLDEPVPPARGQYTHAHTREWAAPRTRLWSTQCLVSSKVGARQ